MQSLPRILITSWLAILSWLAPNPAWSFDESCQLRHPIVLSHHWGMRHICSPTAPASGPSSCVEAADYERYCAQKSINAQGQRVCKTWAVPPDEAELPPRNVNVHDSRLTRKVSAFHRYFSPSIVKALSQTCGNKVYIADKPPFASTEIRARSLRLTVLQALAAEKADQVIVIGVSQGALDARYMAARLDVDSATTTHGTMKNKVAAIVSLAGDNGGAESASLALSGLFALNMGRWGNRTLVSAWTEDLFNRISWAQQDGSQTRYLMTEQCQGEAECTPTADQKYRWTIRSYFDLSTRYMRPNALERLLNRSPVWQGLRDYLGVKESNWQEIIPPSLEANNGIAYFSYGAQLGQWQDAWGLPWRMDWMTYWLIKAVAGDNDGYVSVKRQRFDNAAANFHDMGVLSSPSGGRGYHHMFFTGRNESLYTPEPDLRHPAPYNGDVAQVYQQIARDLKNAGF